MENQLRQPNNRYSDMTFLFEVHGNDPPHAVSMRPLSIAGDLVDPVQILGVIGRLLKERVLRELGASLRYFFLINLKKR